MTYDLTREPWIPVRWITGEEGAPAVGLREALREAHRLREVTAPPLQTAALYRLLQALFIRLYVHPEGAPDDEGWDDDAWFDLWEHGRLDPERIAAYFDRWQDERERFDLLHPERPFYGHPHPTKPSEGRVNWLVPVWAKGNNETLFDHTTDDACASLRLPEAARALVETQAWALGGLAGPGRLRFEDAPLSRGLVFWIRGSSLFEALLLNTPPVRFARMRSGTDDLPSWEYEELPDNEPSAETGYLSFLTWPSRHVHLTMAPQELVVREVHIAQGKKWVSETHDPLWARRTKKDGSRYPFKLRKEEALWREAPSWLGLRLEDKRELPPATFQWLENERGPGGDLQDADLTWEVDVFGIANDKAKMELIRHERLTLHTSVLRSYTLQTQIRTAIEQANRQAKILRTALYTCAEHLSTESDAATVVDALQGVRRFWAFLETGFDFGRGHEPGFAQWLDALAALAAVGPEGSDARAEAARYHLLTWSRTLHRAALRAYDEATEAFVGSPRRMEAVALGRARLRAVGAYSDALAESTPSPASSAHA